MEHGESPATGAKKRGSGCPLPQSTAFKLADADLEGDVGTNTDFERLVVVDRIAFAVEGAFRIGINPGVAHLGIEIDAGTHGVVAGDHSTVLLEVGSVGRAVIVAIQVRVLQTNGPGVHRVADATAGRPVVDLITSLVEGVVEVFEHATDGEVAEGEVQAGLVEVLRIAIRTRRLLDVAFPRSAAARGQTPAITLERVGGI